MKIIVIMIPKNLVTNQTIISFLSSHRNQKQESHFQQVGGLVTKKTLLLFACNELRSTSKLCRIP